MVSRLRTLECKCPECNNWFGIPLKPGENPTQGWEVGALCPFCETTVVLRVGGPPRQGEITIEYKLR